MKEKIFEMSEYGPFKAKVDERFHKLGQDCPDDGWVAGYLLRDLHQGEILPHIFNCPCTWVVKEETIEPVGFHIAQWIKVEDRLPEIMVQVLVAYHDYQGHKHYSTGNLALMDYEYCFDIHNAGETISLEFIDYWMPIVLPKED